MKEAEAPEEAGGLGPTHVCVGVEARDHHDGWLPLAGNCLVGHTSKCIAAECRPFDTGYV
jgi:hypothetical protein